MRLIDANKLGLTDFEILMCDGDYKEALKMVLSKIDNAPIIDAVPVVRCRDCTFYLPDGVGDPDGVCTNSAFWMTEDGYCSCARRRGEDNE